MRPAGFIMALARYAITRLADHGCRVFAFKGEDMAQQTKPRVKPDPAQPIVTVDEIDEALLHTSLSRARDDNWHRWADALLDQRNRLAHPQTQKETP
jgi:hypothetical protein